MNTMEVLQTRGELLFWKCKRELEKPRISGLREQSIREQDEVERAKRSIFAKLRGNYDENLGKEKAESVKAQLKLERVEKLLADAEEKIPVLEEKIKENTFLYNVEEFGEEERELHDWCCLMEKACDVISLTNRCVEEGESARLTAYSGPGDKEKCMAFQEDMILLMPKIEKILSATGRIRFLPGMRMKTMRGTRRNLLMNGKTLIYFCKGHSSVEIDILDFDLSELYGSWAVGETLDRKLKELAELKQLLRDVIEEKIFEGEELLRKSKRNAIMNTEKDIFGFEKER